MLQAEWRRLVAELGCARIPTWRLMGTQNPPYESTCSLLRGLRGPTNAVIVVG